MEQLRTYYKDLQTASFHAKILSDLDQSTLEYEVDYEYNKEGSDHLTLTAPEDLQGIQATISGENELQMTLEYGDTALDTPGASLSGFAPMDVISYLLYDLRDASPTEIWSERMDGEQVTVLRYARKDGEQDTEKQIWLSEKSLSPICAEMFIDGQRVLRCVFSGFQT